MIEQTAITKRLIKDTIHEYLIDNGFNKKETKNIRMCLDKICENEFEAIFVFEFIEETFCHNLGLENKHILDFDEFSEYLYDKNVDDKKFVELIYQKILNEYSVVKRSKYIADRFLEKFVFLNEWNAFIYFSIGIFLLVVFIMIFVTPVAQAIVKLFGIDNFYIGVFEWGLIFLYSYILFLIPRKSK